MRSRLESRWAAFFDALGTPWHYELHRYTMPGQHAYSPDFHLPGLGVILEVKPHRVTERKLADKYAAYGPELVRRGACNLFVFAIGSPRPGIAHAAFWRHGERSWSFASVFGEREVEWACDHADRLRHLDVAPVPPPNRDSTAAFDMLSMDELRSLSVDEVHVALRFKGRTIRQLRADADCVQYLRELERERAERERAQ